MTDSPRKALITGATGFLGGHLKTALLKNGVDVVALGSLDCNLTDYNQLLAYRDNSFDYIYHLAAFTKAGDFSLTHAGDQWLVNQLINTHVLKFWREEQPRAKLIAMGSGGAYPPGELLREEDYMRGEPEPNYYTYGLIKRVLFQGMRAIGEQDGLDYCMPVPSVLYGPGYKLDDRHFIFDLIRKICAAKDSGGTVTLWGDGNQVREVVYIEDAVTMILNASDKISRGLLNLGSGAGLSIKDYALAICDLVGLDASAVEYDTRKPAGVPRRVMDTSLRERSFPMEFTPLKVGLGRTLEYYRSKTSDPDHLNLERQ